MSPGLCGFGVALLGGGENRTEPVVEEAGVCHASGPVVLKRCFSNEELEVWLQEV